MRIKTSIETYIFEPLVESEPGSFELYFTISIVRLSKIEVALNRLVRRFRPRE
jgi:hypothetical protein